MTGCALALALFVVPGQAQADPQQSEEELQAKISKLTTKAEVLTEKYNGQKLELREAKKSARQAGKRSKRTQRRLDRVRGVLADVAASQYKGGSAMRQPMAMLSASSPQEFLDRASMLRHLSEQRRAQLRELEGSLQRVRHAEQEARQAAERVREITKQLESKKQKIERLVAKAEDELAEVQQDPYTPAQFGDLGSGVVARAVEIALAQQGDPYVWGAAGPDSFDCSGLIVYAFGQVGVSMPHYTGALWDMGPRVSRSQLQVGDFVYTSSHHVGIYVGNGQMVHAPNSGSVVRVDDIWSFYGAVRPG